MHVVRIEGSLYIRARAVISTLGGRKGWCRAGRDESVGSDGDGGYGDGT